MAQSPEYILGLDLGANSLGWALLEAPNGEPRRIIRAGVRIFEAGVEGDIKSGQDASRAIARREKRLHRRMLARHKRRLKRVATLLQSAGLLPPGDLAAPDARHQFFVKLDKRLYDRYFKNAAPPTNPHVLPYFLRARALETKLAPEELGRALYHLAQRRGFLSTRKRGPKAKDEDEGKVREEIAFLAQQMGEAKVQTLGEFFARINPADPNQRRIRQRWTSRDMYKKEFDLIWAKQAPYYPSILTDDFKRTLYRAIFFQRPLKSQAHLVRNCELEPGRKCAPIALLDAQRFRYLQKVNDLEIINTTTGLVQKLSDLPQQRAALIQALETYGDLRFRYARKRRESKPSVLDVLGLSDDHVFNFEQKKAKEEAEDTLIGNRTAARLIEVFGLERWQALSPQEQDRVVEDLLTAWDLPLNEQTLSIEEIEAEVRKKLLHRATEVWKLDPQAAEKFAALELEDGYFSLSIEAIRKLLPHLERGIPLAQARKTVYGALPGPGVFDALPPVKFAPMPEVRNPAVMRALSELRRVVNAIVKQYGKPALIRIELARELKKPRKERQAIAEKIEQNRKARKKAAEAILKEFPGRPEPSRRDVEKFLLAEECGWQCPYTGKPINMQSLFGPEPQFDIEHIIPIGRCFDDSFMNKTLCHNEENRHTKNNKTPWEAYGHDPKRWGEILQRVRDFKGPGRAIKLRRFQLTQLDSLDTFTSQQLNDTKYASRLARRYLGLLYGAGADGIEKRPDGPGTVRVQVGRGQVTQYIRDELGLNSILGDGGEKAREDHRHHAVDAIAIALTDFAMVKKLSDASKRALLEGRKRFGAVQPPWPNFLQDARAAILGIIVSHRVSRKVQGPLHDETIYSKIHRDEQGRECVHVRKPLSEKFTEAMIEDIVDRIVRERVRAHFKRHNKNPKAAFGDRNNHPFLEAKSGQKIPIHRVRIRVRESTIPLHTGRVKTGSNHHVEIFEVTDSKGRPKWDGCIVTRYEAMRRLRNGEPIVKRNHGSGKKWVFSLAGGDVIELDGEQGSRHLYVVRTITTSRLGEREYVNIAFVNINDARKKADIIKAKNWRTALLEPLRKMTCRKVVVTPLGEVRWAND